MATALLRWLVVGLVTLGGTVLGIAGAALRTAAGRSVVTRAAIEAGSRAIDGSLTVERVGGSLVSGLEAHGVAVRDPTGQPVVSLPVLRLQYRLNDLLSGRIVLGQLTLIDPQVRLVQDSTGTLNLERVLRLAQPGNGAGTKPLIAFRDVLIEGARVTLSTPAESGQVRERQVDDLNGRLPYVRLSSPLPLEQAILVEVGELRAHVSDPALDVRSLRGRISLLGDSLTVDLSRVELPNTQAAVKGAIAWPEGSPLFSLRVDASRFATADARAFVSRLPKGLVGRARLGLQSRGADVTAISAENLMLTGARDGGTLRGHFRLVVGPGDHSAIENADLSLDRLNLEFVRPLLDTLPLVGRLSGTIQADGPAEQLHVRVDWTFQDSLIPDQPQSFVQAEGVVALTGPAGFAFDGLTIDTATVALASAARLVPVDLLGELDLRGTLEGPWRQMTFDGLLRHRDGTLPATVSRGAIRIDATRDTLGVWADVTLDSLQLDGIRHSYPALSLGGAMAGTVHLAGYLDSLALRATLAGPAGDLSVEGALILLSPTVGARNLQCRFARLDLSRLKDAWPPSTLAGRAVGSVVLDTLSAPSGRLSVALNPSLLAGAALDSGRAVLSTADSLLRVDSLGVWAPELSLAGHGGLSLTAARSDSLVATLRADSVGVLEPVLQWLGGETFATSVDTAPRGPVLATLRVSGSFQRYELAARVRTSGLRWGVLTATGADLAGRWNSADRGGVALDATLDSLTWEGMAFTAVEARVNGRRDSLNWFGRSRIGEDASWLAGGAYGTHASAAEVRIDSVAVLVPSEVWFLRRPTRVVVSDSAITVDSTALTSVSGAAGLTIAGRVPRAGSGALGVSVVGLPIADVWALLQKDPTTVSGQFSGTATLGGTARAPVIHGAMALVDFGVEGFRAPYVDGTFDYRKRQVSGQFGLWRAGNRIMGIDIGLPFDLALRGAPADRRLPGPVMVRARAEGVDLSVVGAMVTAARQTAGRLSADFGIAGTWQRPQLTGTLTISDGAASFPALGVRHQDLNGRFTLSGDTIRLDALSVKSGDGTATVSGYIRLIELTRPDLHLQIAARNFRAMDVRDYLSVTASGDLALRGPVIGSTLTGQGTVTRGVLYFQDLLEKQVINLQDVRYANIIDTSLVRRQGLGEEFQNRFIDSLKVDSLRLSMGSDVWLRSGEANIQLTGDLTIDKVANRYRVDGTLQTPRGTYRLPLTTSVTREFTVTRGQLQYFGTPDLNAALDIDARNVVRLQEQTVAVTVHIGGNLYDPRLTFSSDLRPPVSETEIMRMLLGFGGPAGAGASDVQLANSILTRLAGFASGQIERSLITDLGVPLDYFQIRAQAALAPGGGPGSVTIAGTEIAVGKQVNLFGLPTFWTASPRICPGDLVDLANLGLSAEVHLSRQWLLAASRDPVGYCSGLGVSGGLASRQQFGLDLFWERSY